ncbi:hypothetical protein KUTeg_016618 [Tegillarca granosa]|uniref:Ig-like domain-containing protein n=1 Tax=Tegillarca granosa TaxID=220873 RepID=A0ABQ9ES11_TEGGR|nr:hypothetical protein KUTeg_016618 [Tegillarca granosa]
MFNDRNIKIHHDHLRTRFIFIALLIVIAVVIIIVLVVFFTNEQKTNKGDPKVLSVPRQITSLVGSNIKLSCSLETRKKEIQWYFQDKPVSVGDRISISEGSLSIQNIKPNDGGEYTCGTDDLKSKSISLAVVEVLLKNVTSQTGEGPHWEQATQSLFFVDHFARQLHRWNSFTGQHDIETFGKQNHEFLKVFLIKKDISINDGKVDPKGRVWTDSFGHFSSKFAKFV